MDTSFIENRHKTYADIDQELLFDSILRLTGIRAKMREKIVMGYDNEVYSITSTDGQQWIARINRFGETSLFDEAWALEACMREGAPVPSIFGVGKLESADGELELMVQAKVTGRSWAEIDGKLSESDRRRLLIHAMEALKIIHQIPADGFYRRRNGNWDFPYWEAIMDSAIRDRGSEREDIIAGGFSEQQFDLMMRYLQYFKQSYPCEQPVLCQGDFTPKHIFVDNQLQITGIIDFGMFQGGPPIHDISYLTYRKPGLDLDTLRVGYGLDDSLDHFESLIHLNNLGLQMGSLAYELSINDIRSATFTASRLQYTLMRLQDLVCL